VLDLHFDVTLGSFRAAIDLSTPSGETTVVLGESGSGKTTVLRVLAGLLSPQKGFLVLDDDVYLDTDKGIAVPTQDRPIGYVFQDYALFPHLSVYDNIAFGLKMQRIPKGEVRQRVAQALTQAHLVGYDDRRPRELSGGQQQRVAIARALALRPRLLLLDESLSALDIQTRHQVVRELREILADLGLTSVMVSHQYSDALNLAHHIMVLERGLVIQEGTHLDLLQHPRSSYIAELTGVNRFEGTIVRYDGATGTCRVRLSTENSGYVEVDGVHGLGSDRGDGLSVGAAAIVVVHPRNVQLCSTIPSLQADNVVPCVVSQVTPVSASLSAAGPRMEGLLRAVTLVDPLLPTLTADMTVDVSSHVTFSEGDQVSACFSPRDVSVFANEIRTHSSDP
jgi:molybdate transport system ATP-binding protein